MIIVFEGVDGVGKATQASRLKEELEKLGLDKVYLFSFPQYGSPTAYAVEEYLDGRYDGITPTGAALLFGVDRLSWAAKYRDLLEDPSAIIILDRYTTSNSIYAAANTLVNNVGISFDELYDNVIRPIYHVEYVDFKLPQPDMIIYLQPEDYEVIRNQKEARGRSDIHEDNDGLLMLATNIADDIAARDGWDIVKVTENYKMRSIEAISADVLNHVAKAMLENRA